VELFGFNITRRPRVESVSVIARAAQNLQSVYSQAAWSSSWWGGPILESYTGAWQSNVTLDPQTNILAFSPVYCCVTGIASDVAKLRIKLSRNNNGIWEEITEAHGNSTAASVLPVLRKPNRYQTHIQFVRQWILSKLLSGNTYVLKEREFLGGPVIAMYVLNPMRVKTLVADDGSVWYELQTDYLSGVEDVKTLPASEIIHDRMPELWHDLIGISPLYACGVSATMGNKIQANSTNLFANASRPGGMILVPGFISAENAAALKAAFESGYSGANVGKIAVLGDGMKFEPMTLTAEALQQVEQLKWTVDDVGRAFHYPVWKMNSGAFPPYSSGPDALELMYLNQCLHPLIEDFEACLDEGLELPARIGTELDIDNLLRMDTASLYDSNGKAVGGGWMSPDEARYRANLPPVPGGSSPMAQQQNYSLAALAKRDAQADPFATTPAPQPAQPAKETTTAREMTLEDLEFFEEEVRKGLVA
jgi:HK97 family phage portal protein